ncbi:hypothetical protein JHK87_034833 [Glycine soja]|nr:hypothetical protein JHK87_034833 [Glycine soja]
MSKLDPEGDASRKLVEEFYVFTSWLPFCVPLCYIGYKDPLVPSKVCRLASARNRQKIRGPKKSGRSVGESLPRRMLQQDPPGQIKNDENNSWSTIVAGEKDY